MNFSTRDALVAQLTDSQQQLTALLSAVARDQDWRPAHDQWSFRFIAAHLAVGERECLLVRVQQFANEANPQFAWYDNSNRDFSHLDLTDALHLWAEARKEIIAFIRGLTEEKFATTAQHSSYGEITLLDYLKIWLEHDAEHLNNLQMMLMSYRKQTGGKI